MWYLETGKAMRKGAKLFYRIAAVLFLLFAAGHTAGFLAFRPKEAAALAVWDGMNQVHFALGSTTATWGGFYTGFGLFVSVYMLFSVCVAWRLSNAGDGEAAMARTLAWALFAVQLANIGLCACYFGPVQVVFAAACAVTVGLAALKTRPRNAPAQATG
jgi:hypothetical protein